MQAFYHSGHGTMDGNGVFYAPLGAMWDNKDWVNSTQMLLGNERLRYLFWSTCLSLRVLDGQSPIRTWNGRSPGVRMIFGWETVSWDSPVYGRRFWDHWNMRKSFSKAWIDAGWDAGHDQAPSAVGIGASQAEAQNRVFHEGENLGTLQWGAAAQNWWWWTWYTAARSVAPATTLESVPQQAYVFELGDVSRLLPALDGVGRTDVVGDGLARVELTAQSSAALEVSVPPSDESPPIASARLSISATSSCGGTSSGPSGPRGRALTGPTNRPGRSADTSSSTGRRSTASRSSRRNPVMSVCISTLPGPRCPPT